MDDATIRQQIRENAPQVLGTPLIHQGKRSRLKVYVCRGGRYPQAGVDAWAVEIGELETAVITAGRLYPRGFLVFAGNVYGRKPIQKITREMAQAIDSSHYD